MRPGQRTTQRSHPARDRQRTPDHRVAALLSLLLVSGLGAYGYSQYRARSAPTQASTPGVPVDAVSPASPYSCDGRTMCSQMNSCPEATYFIRNCPGTQMDGDGDGVPCESQWCN
jgi:hypothetical protein